MRMRYALILFVALSYCLGPAGAAQSQSSQESNRRILQKTPPVYPDIAKKMNLAGTVRVIAAVLPDGTVKSVEPLGGSPVLLKAAQEAVAKWRFATGGETKEIIELHFSPQ